MIIAISGKINSGKDTVGKIIQYLITESKWKEALPYTIAEYLNGEDVYSRNYTKDCEDSISGDSGWKVVKFADKLKGIVCLLIGCTREQLEDRNFKEKELGEEWWYYQPYSSRLQKYMGKITLSYEECKDDIEKHYSVGIEDTFYAYQRKLTPRLIMQLLGTECGREIIHPSVWINALFADYNYSGGFEYDVTETPYGTIKSISAPKAVKGEYPNWIITDMRFPNELKAVKDRNGITIKITRPISETITIGDNTVGIARGPLTNEPELLSSNHASETALDNAKFDYVIENDSNIDELIHKVRTILKREEVIIFNT